jgi:hypothetical protein
VEDADKIGHAIAFNNAFQYHASKHLWPEVELNSTFWSGGDQDGKKQTFVTPGLVIGRFPIHNRVALTIGAGFQIALTQYHNYNHAAICTIRMPF